MDPRIQLSATPKGNYLTPFADRNTTLWALDTGEAGDGVLAAIQRIRG